MRRVDFALFELLLVLGLHVGLSGLVTGFQGVHVGVQLVELGFELLHEFMSVHDCSLFVFGRTRAAHRHAVRGATGRRLTPGRRVCDGYHPATFQQVPRVKPMRYVQTR